MPFSPLPCIIRKPLSLSTFSDGPPKHPEQLDCRCRSAHGVELSIRRRYQKNTLACPCILRGHPSPHESPDRRSGVPCLLKQPCAPRTMLRQRARFACLGVFCSIESAHPRRCVPFIARLPDTHALSRVQDYRETHALSHIQDYREKPMLSPVYEITR